MVINNNEVDKNYVLLKDYLDSLIFKCQNDTYLNANFTMQLSACRDSLWSAMQTNNMETFNRIFNDECKEKLKNLINEYRCHRYVPEELINLLNHS